MKRTKCVGIISAFMILGTMSILLISSCTQEAKEHHSEDATVQSEFTSEENTTNDDKTINESEIFATSEEDVYSEPVVEVNFIRPQGMTLEERIAVPEGYTRSTEADGSLGEFLRNYPMKEDNSPVLLYDGSQKGNQSAHVAVFDMPVVSGDLQQCADSIMRIYSEYFWSTGQPERIRFHFVNGFLCDYNTYRDGGRVRVSGNDVSWEMSAGYDESYEALEQYMRTVFMYASTLSMEEETTEITTKELSIGDIFIYGGSPGHVCMVADLCEKDGQKAFLLAQGYMPAQDFHILANPSHTSDPWYYEEEVVYPFVTPEYVFDEGSLRRPSY